MGDDHPIVEGLLALSEVEADHLRRRAVPDQPHAEVEPTQLGAEADLPDPCRGVTVQASPAGGPPKWPHGRGPGPPGTGDAHRRPTSRSISGTISKPASAADRYTTRTLASASSPTRTTTWGNDADSGVTPWISTINGAVISESLRDLDEHAIGGKGGMGCSQLVVIDGDQPPEARVVLQFAEATDDRRIGRRFD